MLLIQLFTGTESFSPEKYQKHTMQVLTKVVGCTHLGLKVAIYFFRQQIVSCCLYSLQTLSESFALGLSTSSSTPGISTIISYLTYPDHLISSHIISYPPTQCTNPVFPQKSHILPTEPSFASVLLLCLPSLLPSRLDMLNAI